MAALVVVVGTGLILLALFDVAWTTIAAGSGAGPLTSRIAELLWRSALRFHRMRPSHSLLSIAGVVIVFAVLTVWILLVVTGWSLIFAAGDGAVRDAGTGTSADLGARLYFVGYTVFTLGNGEYMPGEGVWQLATVLAAGTGLILVTLSITYLVPVVSAVALRRQMASHISTLGTSPSEIVRTAWSGEGFPGLGQHLETLTGLVNTCRHQLLTYPVLHYFHSGDPTTASAPTVANLAQALHLLAHGVDPAVRPPTVEYEPLQRAIDAYLHTVQQAHFELSTPPVPLASLEPIRALGVPTVDDDEYHAITEVTQKRRALLAALLADDGWLTESAVDPASTGAPGGVAGT